MPHVLIATSNPGKLRDFAGAAAPYGLEVRAVPPSVLAHAVIEDGATFEANARKKAEHYSRLLPGDLVLADDSGLEVDALGGAPGVDSALYASLERGSRANSSDAANNARLLRELQAIADARRTARFVCVLAAARDGRTLATFRGQAEGRILNAARGAGGFGYDPLFLLPALDKTFAELPPEQKAHHSHRGAAFRKFLEWYERPTTEGRRPTT